MRGMHMFRRFRLQLLAICVYLHTDSLTGMRAASAARVGIIVGVPEASPGYEPPEREMRSLTRYLARNLKVLLFLLCIIHSRRQEACGVVNACVPCPTV